EFGQPMVKNAVWMRAAGLCLASIGLSLSVLRSFCGQQAERLQVPQNLEVADVEAQPLASNVQRLIQALEVLGTPLPVGTSTALQAAGRTRDAGRIQQLLDQQVLFVVRVNPEARVKAVRGPAQAVLQQSGFTPVLIKVVNESAVTQALRITSP